MDAEDLPPVPPGPPTGLRLIPGAPEDVPHLDGLFLALETLSQRDCDCKPLMTLLLEVANELVFLHRMLLALHGRKMPPSPAGSQVPPGTSTGMQYFVP